MNKKEQAAFAAMQDEARLARALRFTDPVKEDVPPPEGFQALTKGFLAWGDRVEVACSSAVSHAFGRDDKTTTQNSRWLFSTRLLALRAARHRMEREFAKKLADIDKKIEIEMGSE